MMNVDSEKLERVMDSFRRWGYLQANLDPARPLQAAAAS